MLILFSALFRWGNLLKVLTSGYLKAYFFTDLQPFKYDIICCLNYYLNIY